MNQRDGRRRGSSRPWEASRLTTPTEGSLWERDANIVKRLWEINERFAAIDDEYKTLSAEARALRRERTANMIRMGKATAEVSGGE